MLTRVLATMGLVFMAGWLLVLLLPAASGCHSVFTALDGSGSEQCRDVLADRGSLAWLFFVTAAALLTGSVRAEQQQA